MKICTNCGAPIEDEELFCGKCGTKQGVELDHDQETEEVAETVIWTGRDTASDTDAEINTETDVSVNPVTDTAANMDTAEPPNKNTVYLHNEEPIRESKDFIFCPKCGAKNSAGDQYCVNCGTDLSGNEEEVITPSQPAKGKINKRIIAGAAVIAVAAVAAVGGVMFLGGKSGSTSEKLVYYKDNSNIQYTIKNKKSLEITDHATEDKTGYEMMNSIDMVSYSEDGRYVFYAEKVNSDGVGTLMYKNLKKHSNKKDTSEKLDSNVRRYRLFSSGKVLYLKGDLGDMSLYLSDLNDKTKIGSGIRNYVVSKDESCLIFMTEDDNIYTFDLKKKNASKEKLDTEVSYICASNDLKYIYYTKEEKLMCVKNLKDKEKVASGFDGDWAYAEGGKSIYYTLPGKEYQITDFITDEQATADSKMQRPNQNDYRVASGVDWFGSTTYTVDIDKYNSAVETYNKKLQRDEIRNRLDNLGSVTLNDLYLYDGKESTKISDTVLDIEATAYSDKDSTDKVICVSQINLDNLGEYNISFIESASDASDKLTRELSESKKYYLVTGTAMNPFDVENEINSTRFDLDNHTFYYSDDRQDDGTATLYAVSYSDKSVNSPEKIADDVSGLMLFNDKIGYWSDNNDREATLNVSGEEIDDDVSTIGFTPISPEEDNSIYYAKDLSERDYSFTLYRYQKGKSVKIADDIIYFKPLEGGKIAYLQDYNLDKYRGDLCIWISEQKQNKIDEDVSYIKDGYGNIY